MGLFSSVANLASIEMRPTLRKLGKEGLLVGAYSGA